MEERKKEGGCTNPVFSFLSLLAFLYVLCAEVCRREDAGVMPWRDIRGDIQMCGNSRIHYNMIEN